MMNMRMKFWRLSVKLNWVFFGKLASDDKDSEIPVTPPRW
jgi:hypothetical protein